MNIRTILFDLDGTLIDTNELINESFLYTFNKFGLEFTREELLSFNGPSLQQTFEQIDLDKAEAMITTYKQHNIAHHDEYVEAFPNVKETLTILKEHGIKLGIVTSKIRDTAIRGLKITGIYEFFETIIAIDDVSNPKPHPEPILSAMKNLNADPTSTLMVGDNHHDIDAGHNANVLTAGVAWSLKGEETLLTYKPTYMLHDMKDLLEILEV
ncbi:pyrophosphatase PpaX [Ornithinibacillus halotolerans]|uniref:Pyrophosphatase PpaX n=1 Tax=Ornithinibacillus halotolerans TaxID=1274357 RepID=A0A916RSD4_9BACI|nr:pyrophosphatase PpaX [Ornithinibacillus halotolerans]GGA67372.1 pyrophosphatase PpaX [Ornithinibacillus halotolerans]